MSPTVWRVGTAPANSGMASRASRTALAVMRVKANGVWNLGSAWAWGSTSRRMCSSNARWRSSVVGRPRDAKSSTQRMPELSSFRPVRTASRPHPKVVAARRAEPPQYAFVISAGNRRRLCPVSSVAANRIACFASSVRSAVTASSVRPSL